MKITPLYAAILALTFIALSVRTLRLRGKLRIAIGDAGNQTMLRAMRVHANFAEYVPFSLIMLFLVETQGAAAWAVHALGSLLVAGRLLHAYGVSQSREVLAFRVAGMAATFTVLSAGAVYLLLRAA